MTEYDENGLLTNESLVLLIAEMDRLIAEWCNRKGLSEMKRKEMQQKRYCMAPLALPAAVEKMQAAIASLP